jgi:hypothetical protein
MPSWAPGLPRGNLTVTDLEQRHQSAGNGSLRQQPSQPLTAGTFAPASGDISVVTAS